MHKYLKHSTLLLSYFLLTMIGSGSLLAAEVDKGALVKDMQIRWATVNYQQKSKTQKKAFKQLVEDANKEAEQYPDSAEILTWAGIINSSYAGIASTFSAMSYAKQAKADFEKAISIDGDALAGSAYTSLGTLYYKVPGGFIGFGDDDKAAEWLLKGLQVNPDGIDSNYFYADYLYEEKKYEAAKEHLQKALKAAPRPDRPIADKGRKNDIMKLLAEIDRKLD